MDSESEASNDGFSEVESLPGSIRSDISFHSSDVSDVSTPDVSDDSLVAYIEDADSFGNVWTRKIVPPDIPAFEEEVGSTFKLESCENEIDFFLQFFSGQLIERLVLETNEYARSCCSEKPDSKWKETNVPELSAFLGLHVVFSILGLTSYSLGWITQWPFETPAIGQIISRNRFEKLTKYFSANSTKNNPPRGCDGHDKLCVVRPVLDEVSKACLINYRPHREQTVDEAFLPYKGQLSFKQQSKSSAKTKTGIKIWERADPHNGYVHEFQVYTGRPATGEPRTKNLASRVVKDLTAKLSGKAHRIYMDSFFSSTQLFNDMLTNDLFCTGTVKINSKGMPEAIKTTKLKNKGDHVVMQNNGLSVIGYNDRALVYFLTSCENPHHTKVVRKRQKDGSYQDMLEPIVVDSYNRFKMGVSLAEQKRTVYSTCRKAHDWWKHVFWFCFDVAIANALTCMQESPNHQTLKKRKRTQAEFRIALAQQLIGSYRCSSKTVLSVLDSFGNGHWPMIYPKRGRCKQCAVEQRRCEVLLGCKQCGIRLCVKNDCFFRYHMIHMMN